VIVDSAPHLYELKQLLLAGLEQQLLLACAVSGLRKINLKPGRCTTGKRANKDSGFREVQRGAGRLFLHAIPQCFFQPG